MLSRALPALALLSGCLATADDGAVRQAWLVEALGDDNRVWLSRDPSLLATKYAKMADDPYDYLRGTAGVALRDQGRPGADRRVTAFLTVPEAAEVLLAGDPHPENVGVLRPGPLVLEVNDFDGSVFGPYLFDLRRLTLGLAWLADEGGLPPAQTDAVVDAAVRAYVQTLSEQVPWGSGLVPGREDPVTDALLVDVIEEGEGRERLLEYTERTASGRRFRPMAGLDDEGRGVLPLTVEEGRQLDRLLAGWAAPAGFRALDRARRFGSGVASLPSVRYVVVYDLGDDGPDDDAMLSIREVVDPPAVPGVHPGAPAYWADGAERIEATARTLWSRPDADPLYAGLQDGPMTFKVQAWTAWHSGYDHGKLLRAMEEGTYDVDDLTSWATTLGHLLGAMHGRAPTARGGDARTAILFDIAGRGEGLIDELQATTWRDLVQLRTDHALFVDALDRFGPLLGADLLEER